MTPERNAGGHVSFVAQRRDLTLGLQAAHLRKCSRRHVVSAKPRPSQVAGGRSGALLRYTTRLLIALRLGI
jgi:hypothetical protein